MCARYSLIASAEDLVAWFKLRKELELAPRYNIAPTQPVGVVRQEPEGGGRRFDLMHWGLIPNWAKDASFAWRTINARSETAAEKPSFRAAFRRRRCLVPVSGYYEWQKTGGPKQPYFIRMGDGGVFAFAGLWESWSSPEGSEIDSCTILTMAPNERMAAIHDRMPVILPPERYDAWLDTGQTHSAPALDLIRSIPEEALTAIPVTPHVNNPRHEGPECIAPQAGDGV
ncbi:MAG: SOS response-associated peptidase [SAR324 cluster bacterium]|nr:SOS response-associated peptidase [SAR324 cluster bacterium]